MVENLNYTGKLERYLCVEAPGKDLFEKAVAFVLEKIDANIPKFTYKFPSASSNNNVYDAWDNTDWTASFWTGMLWLAYEYTGNNKYRDVAEAQLESYRKRLDEKINIDHHDLGFLYSLSCVASYKLTGNTLARDTALKAADYLLSRYHEKAGIIQAWGDLNDPSQRGRMIIDCCMNLPLLYWASRITGNDKYYNAAYSHARQAARQLVRDDATTYHTFYMDVETGEPRHGKTQQGYSDDSCWSRGQAWGIYGFPLTYAYTKDWNMIEVAEKLSKYFLNRLPDDHVCYWDLIFTGGQEEKDSSAASIAVCGLLEISGHLPVSSKYKRIYENAALEILKSLAANYTSKGCPHADGVLLHGVYAKPGGAGVDECMLWGDYFYFEALVRVLKDWKMYW